MSARKSNSGKVVSGAELRARREARVAATDPRVEAQRREASLLKSLTTARGDFDWFVSTQAWTHLGFETFTGWWLAKVQPVADGLMKPVREVARAAMDIMAEEQKALPPAQRLRQRDIAAAVGASQATVSRRTRDADASDVDLGESTEEQAGAHAPRDAGQEEPAIPPVGSSTPNSPTGPDPSVISFSGEEGTDGDRYDGPAGEQTAADPDALVASAVDSSAEESTGEGSGVRPGPSPLDHPGAKPGEASAEGGPSASGARSRLREGEKTAGVQVSPEPGAPAVAQELDEEEGPSTSDPDLLVRTVEGWAWAFDETDVDVIGPLLSENQLIRLEVAADVITEKVGLLRTWKERS